MGPHAGMPGLNRQGGVGGVVVALARPCPIDAEGVHVAATDEGLPEQANQPSGDQDCSSDQEKLF